jgi:hypothetical protein
MLRVLLACLVLWISTGPSIQPDVWTQTAAMIAHGAPPLRRVAPAEPASRASQETQSAKRIPTPLPVSGAEAVSPAARKPRALLVVEDVYLRNCALLC